MTEELSCLPAIGVPGVSRKFGGPALQGKRFKSEINFINDRITDLRQFEAGDPPRTGQ